MLRQVKLLALLLTVPVGLHAQTSGLCRERTAIVNVLDPNGAPITNLETVSKPPVEASLLTWSGLSRGKTQASGLPFCSTSAQA
jgi:hypothetical protein